MTSIEIRSKILGGGMPHLVSVQTRMVSSFRFSVSAPFDASRSDFEDCSQHSLRNFFRGDQGGQESISHDFLAVVSIVQFRKEFNCFLRLCRTTHAILEIPQVIYLLNIPRIILNIDQSTSLAFANFGAVVHWF